MKRILAWAILIPAALALLAACKIDSINPISPVESAQPDAGLYGLWRYRAKGELTYVHIGPEFSLRSGDPAAAEDPRTRIVLVDHKPNGITDEAHVAYASRIGRQRYLNVVQADEGRPVGYLFVRYTLIDGNTLRFSTMNEEALKAAIGAGRIRGTTRGDGLASETAITAGSAEIGNFLKSDGATLFTTPVVLRRVQDR